MPTVVFGRGQLSLDLIESWVDCSDGAVSANGMCAPAGLRSFEARLVPQCGAVSSRPPSLGGSGHARGLAAAGARWLPVLGSRPAPETRAPFRHCQQPELARRGARSMPGAPALLPPPPSPPTLRARRPVKACGRSCNLLAFCCFPCAGFFVAAQERRAVLSKLTPGSDDHIKLLSALAEQEGALGWMLSCPCLRRVVRCSGAQAAAKIPRCPSSPPQASPRTS